MDGGADRGSGKTTIMAWLLSNVPNNRRLITIEEGSREFDLVKRDEDGNILNSVVHLLTDTVFWLTIRMEALIPTSESTMGVLSTEMRMLWIYQPGVEEVNINAYNDIEVIMNSGRSIKIPDRFSSRIIFPGAGYGGGMVFGKVALHVFQHLLIGQGAVLRGGKENII